ncbi:MAG: flagellar motor switch protein FliN [Candidatus Poribacteria bacterium]|nr:flagellar motor switch protein FliN [Candidatus Poribacteria bacterium]
MEEKSDLNEMLGENEGAVEDDDAESSQGIAEEPISEDPGDMGLIEEDFSFAEGEQDQPVVADGLEELLADVELEVIIELGRTRKALRDIYDLKIGTIVELDKQAREPIDILVNNSPVARGEVMVFEDALAVRVTEIMNPTELVKKN